jgi:hypothetical protein
VSSKALMFLDGVFFFYLSGEYLCYRPLLLEFGISSIRWHVMFDFVNSVSRAPLEPFEFDDSQYLSV